MLQHCLFWLNRQLIKHNKSVTLINSLLCQCSLSVGTQNVFRGRKIHRSYASNHKICIGKVFVEFKQKVFGQTGCNSSLTILWHLYASHNSKMLSLVGIVHKYWETAMREYSLRHLHCFSVVDVPLITGVMETLSISTAHLQGPIQTGYYKHLFLLSHGTAKETLKPMSFKSFTLNAGPVRK